MNISQLSDKLILPVLAGKTPEQQRRILLALRKESGLRGQVWIDQQLAKLEKEAMPEQKCPSCGAPVQRVEDDGLVYFVCSQGCGILV